MRKIPWMLVGIAIAAVVVGIVIERMTSVSYKVVKSKAVAN